MAFPKLLQKLFQNNGAGDKLRSEILPEMNYLPTSGGTVSGDIAFSNSMGFIRKANKNGYLALSGGNNLSTDGAGSAILWLCGGDASSPINSPGAFSLEASKGTYGQPGFSSFGLKGQPDGSLTWGGKPVLCGESAGFPVGFLALYAGGNVPDGWFRCDGSTIANMATNYPKLYAVLGTNVLPNYSGRYPLGSVTGINATVEAGLPEISGDVWYLPHGAHVALNATGAFRSEADGKETGNADNKGGTEHLSFRASRSNNIYGASSTVQPPSVKCAFLIKHD